MAEAAQEDHWTRGIAQCPSFYLKQRKRVAEYLAKYSPLTRPLFEIQKTGVAHLSALKYGCLFDEMGVGKTAQALAISEMFYRDKLTLVLCPSNVKSVWQAEIKKFTRCRESDIYIGKADDFIHLSVGAVKSFRYFIVNFEAIMAAGKRGLTTVPPILKYASHVVVDEVHNIKNPRTKKFMAFFHYIKQAPPDALTLMSGTPLDKYAGDFWSYLALMDLNPHIPGFPFHDVFSNFSRWESEYSEPMSSGAAFRGIKKDRIPEIDAMMGWKMLRRHTTDVHELPPLSRQDIEIPDEEFDIDMEAVKLEFEKGLRMLSARSWIDDDERGVSPEAGLGIMQKARVELAEAKAPFTWEMISRYFERADKLVAYTDFHCSKKILVEHAQAAGYPVLTITGHDKKSERDEKLEQYRAFKGKMLLVATFGALSEGTNLQCANVMFFSDIPWRPLTRLQAERRIWRMGQDKKCYLVNMLCSADSVVLNSILRKVKIIDAFDGIFKRKKREITDEAITT